MTKVKNPLFSLNAKGKLGPIVITRLKDPLGKASVKRPPANPKSPAQQLMRSYYGSGVETYRTLDKPERLYYHNLYPRQKGNRAYLNFMKEWLMARLPLHAPDHAETGRDPITDPLDLAAIPDTLTGKDADTLDGQHGAYYAPLLTIPRPKNATTTFFTHPGMIGGYYGGTTLALLADTMYYTPMLIHNTKTLDLLGFEITAAGAAGKLARLGIYNANSDWQPTSLVLDAGTVSVASTGMITIPINQQLPPGAYLVALITNGTPTVRLTYGQVPSLVIATTTASNHPGNWRVSIPYNALPTPGTPWDTSTNTTSPGLMVFVRESIP